MKLNLRRTAIVLLGVISLSLVFELVSTHYNPIQCEKVSHNTQPQDTSDDHNSCDDVCQSGLCHFGHCSHMTISNVQISLIIPIMISFYKTESFHFPLSKADEPARPPRLS